MIRLERQRQSISNKLSGIRLTNANDRLYRSYQLGVLAIQDSFWKEAHASLKEESFLKCAYCEAPLKSVSKGAVDHFRPSSGYWWLAYCYDNYVLACGICNSVHKKAQFPIAGRQLAVPGSVGDLFPDPKTATLGQLALLFQKWDAEQAALVDPYRSDPEPLFDWYVDDPVRELRIQPSAAHLRSASQIINILGLNRQDLSRSRYQFYSDTLLVFRLAFSDARTRKASAAIREAFLRPDRAFAGMTRFFGRKWGII